MKIIIIICLSADELSTGKSYTIIIIINYVSHYLVPTVVLPRLLERRDESNLKKKINRHIYLQQTVSWQTELKTKGGEQLSKPPLSECIFSQICTRCWCFEKVVYLFFFNPFLIVLYVYIIKTGIIIEENCRFSSKRLYVYRERPGHFY